MAGYDIHKTEALANLFWELPEIDLAPQKYMIAVGMFSACLFKTTLALVT